MQCALHNHQLVVFEKVAVGAVSRLVNRRFQHFWRAVVVKFEDDDFAAIAVDDPQVSHDGGKNSRVAGVEQVVNLELGKLADFSFYFVKQMT